MKHINIIMPYNRARYRYNELRKYDACCHGGSNLCGLSRRCDNTVNSAARWAIILFHSQCVFERNFHQLRFAAFRCNTGFVAHIHSGFETEKQKGENANKRPGLSKECGFLRLGATVRAVPVFHAGGPGFNFHVLNLLAPDTLRGFIVFHIKSFYLCQS